MAVRTTASVNAARAASSSAEPVRSDKLAATAAAAPSVSRAVSAAVDGTSTGIIDAIMLRYTVVTRLPRIAMPSAPPNSVLVSESAAAIPARSGGAVPTMRSVAIVNTGDSPSDRMT
jgi:hypothetical protein